ncbi:hypothetical protein B0H63DRAFT_445750 [Podospora didyma]|uniref:Uncharacterized protein n=1 Tax=Podospora didyma TaxID=330526 RepID=A0AAE0NXF3_9PEZI|nr:hypothetical protein B0H63DRAFT_445750 [Podospora didyma]
MRRLAGLQLGAIVNSATDVQMNGLVGALRGQQLKPLLVNGPRQPRFKSGKRVRMARRGGRSFVRRNWALFAAPTGSNGGSKSNPQIGLSSQPFHAMPRISVSRILAARRSKQILNAKNRGPEQHSMAQLLAVFSAPRSHWLLWTCWYQDGIKQAYVPLLWYHWARLANDFTDRSGGSCESQPLAPGCQAN